MRKADLEEVISNNLEELRMIRRSNELGECMEAMKDIINLLNRIDIKANKMCIYCCYKNKGYIDDYYNNIGLLQFSVPERGGSYFGYIVHYVVLVDDFVIDLNANAELDSSDDILFELNEYKSIIYSLNKNNTDKMRFIVR